MVFFFFPVNLLHTSTAHLQVTEDEHKKVGSLEAPVTMLDLLAVSSARPAAWLAGRLMKNESPAQFDLQSRCWCGFPNMSSY